MADGWCRISTWSIGEAIDAAHGKTFDLLLGRRTYDIFGGDWPKIENNSMADSLNAATKYVATTGRTVSGGVRSRILGPDILDGIRRVKSTDGADLIVWEARR